MQAMGCSMGSSLPRAQASQLQHQQSRTAEEVRFLLADASPRGTFTEEPEQPGENVHEAPAEAHQSPEMLPVLDTGEDPQETGPNPNFNDLVVGGTDLGVGHSVAVAMALLGITGLVGDMVVMPLVRMECTMDRAKKLTIGLASFLCLCFAVCVVFLGACYPWWKWKPKKVFSYKEDKHVDEEKPRVWTFLMTGKEKTKLLAFVGMVVSQFYFDIYTDFNSLSQFWRAKCQKAYFFSNVMGIAAGALLGAALLLHERNCSREAFLLAAASAFQLVPAGCLVVALYWFVFSESALAFRDSLIYKHGVMALLTTTCLVEGLVEALVSSQVQVHASVNTDMTQGEKAQLMFSATISVFSMAFGLIKLDKEGHALRYIHSKPILTGTAQYISLPFASVVLCRLLGIASRMLFFPFASEIFHKELWSLGTALIVGVDMVVQAIIIVCYHGNKPTWRMLYALPNVISPVEPLLLKGPPVISTAIPISVAVHIIELAAVCCAVLAFKGPSGVEQYFTSRADNTALVKIWIAATVIYLPLLWTIRKCFASPVTVTFGADEKFELDGIQKEELDIVDKNVPMASIYCLQHEVDLTEKDIDDTYAANVLAMALMWGGLLQTLTLTNNKIGDVGVRSLANALRHNSVLQTLTLTDNKIGDNGINSLAQALRGNTALQTLKLRKNDHIGAAGARDLYIAVADNKTLQMLFLCWHTKQCASKLVQVCRKENVSDQVLNFSASSAGNFTVLFLAEMLKQSTPLKKLYLSSNNIGESAANGLADALHQNNILEELRLDRNNIGDIGANSLANALQKNRTLKMLWLNGNSIGDNSAGAWVKALQQNNTLKTLFLSENNIGDAGAELLAHGLSENSTLESLDLHNNKLSADSKEKMKELVGAAWRLRVRLEQDQSEAT